MEKKRAGKKLDPIEIEEYYRHLYQVEHDNFTRDQSYAGVPGHDGIISSIRKYHVFKKSCMASFFDCQGNRHN